MLRHYGMLLARCMSKHFEGKIDTAGLVGSCKREHERETSKRKRGERKVHRVHILTALTGIFLSIDISSSLLSEATEQPELSLAWLDADSFQPLCLSQPERIRRTGRWMPASPTAPPPPACLPSYGMPPSVEPIRTV